MTAEERETLEVYRDTLAYIGRCARDRRRSPRLAVDAIAAIVARAFHQCGDDEPAASPAEAEADRLRGALRKIAVAQWWVAQWMSATLVQRLQSRARRVLRHRRHALDRREHACAAARAVLGKDDNAAEHAAALETGRIA